MQATLIKLWVLEKEKHGRRRGMCWEERLKSEGKEGKRVEWGVKMI